MFVTQWVFAFARKGAMLDVMGILRPMIKPLVAAIAVFTVLSGPGAAQDLDVEQLLADLANPETENWESVERQIRTEWSKSGSAAMDLLYQRGQKALEEEDFEAAIEHLTALTDHAPEFAEGWNARATAYFQKKLYGPAMQDLQRALALNPRHFGAITGVAVILQDTGFEKEALEAWREVFALHPHRPEMIEAMDALEAKVAGQTL